MTGVVIGTSGWTYDHWRGVFYPENLPRTRWFDYYAQRFASVEVNYSFYRLPAERTIASWRDRAPEGFVFALKGSRLISHQLRLRNCEQALTRFQDRVVGLRDRLGVILWQLPPDLSRDGPLLDDFLDMASPTVRIAVEFRHASWLHPSIYSILRDQDAALVWVSSQSMPRDLTRTAGFVYARFHGLSGGFAHDYTTDELEPWVASLRQDDGFAYFNNDASGRAPENAALLREMLGVGRGPPGQGAERGP